MKKYIISIIWVPLFMILPISSRAQITNAGFEQWASITEPVDWHAGNYYSVTPITQSLIKHSGLFAPKGEVLILQGYPFGPYIMAGSEGEGFPVSARYTKLTGYFRYHPLIGEAFQVTVTNVEERQHT